MGPLEGIRVVELAGIGPGPMCAMLLSDMGADVIRITRLSQSGLGIPMPPHFDLLSRGRISVPVDLSHPKGVQLVLNLVDKAHALIEGYRPGVTERLGLGPQTCLERNPRLVYGRMTGWGQDGPLSHAAGHDINYIALTGALHCFGRKGDAPVPPLNLVGDFGGGALYLAFGIVCGILEASRSGKGQVVDAAMVDGASSLMTMFYGLKAMGVWSQERGENILDTGAPFYEVYETADHKYVAIGALEPKFYGELLQRLGLDQDRLPGQLEREHWPELKERLKELFKTKTREQWCQLLEGTDCCFAPVLSMDEAPNHPHNVARGTFVEIDGIVQPAPAPRFSRTKPQIRRPPGPPDRELTLKTLIAWGVAEEEILSLLEQGVLG
ncbi:MAG: CaiB/BaiF CoA transferase family protein [Thermodesulfobacteriota bacterium]